MTNLYYNGSVSAEWTDDIVNTNSGAIVSTNFTSNYLPTASNNVELLSSSPFSTITINRSFYDHTSVAVATRDLTIDSGITLLQTGGGTFVVNGIFSNSGTFVRNTSAGPFAALGHAIVNNGLMTINGVYDYDGMVIAPGSTSLTGSGNLRLRGADLTISDPNGIAYLGNASTISGSGVIGRAGNNNNPDGPVVIHNAANGIVDADLSGQQLRISPGTTPAVNPTTNAGLFEATGGGELLFFESNLDQSGNGTLGSYGAGSTVTLVATTVRGGFIDGSNGGVVVNGTFGGNPGSRVTTIDGRSSADGGLGSVTIKLGGILKSVSSGLTLRGSIINQGQVVDHNIMTIGAGDLTLTGGGSLIMEYPGDNYDSHLVGYDSSVTSTLHNLNNTVSGAGYISVAVDNQNLFLANNADRRLTLDGIAVSNAGTLESSLGILDIAAATITQTGTGYIIADGGSGSTAFVTLRNSAKVVGGTLATVNGGTIQTGLSGYGYGGPGVLLDGSTAAGQVTNLGILVDRLEPLSLKGMIANSGTISVQNTLTSIGAALTGNGQVVLGDSNAVVGGDTLVNVGNTFKGAGFFAAGLHLDNRASGVIDATSTAASMVLQTGNTVQNAGVIEADAGTLVANDAIAGAGHVVVTHGGKATFNADMQQAVSFVGANAGRLTLATSYGGSITGLAAGGSVDLAFLGYATGDRAEWTENTTGTGGVLAIVNAGATVTTLHLVGRYQANSFGFGNDGQNHTVVTTSGPLTSSTVTEPFRASQVSATINSDGSLTLVAPDGRDTFRSVTTVQFTDAVDVVSGNTLTQYNNDGSYTATTFNITGQNYTGAIYSFGRDNSLQSARYTGVTGQPYQAYETDYSNGVYTQSQYFYTGITGQIYTTETLTVNAAGQQTALAYGGITVEPYSAYEADYNAGLFSSFKFTFTSVPAGATYSSYETDYNFASSYLGARFFYTNVSGQSYTGQEVDTNAAGAVTKVLLTGFTGQPYQALELDYTGGAFTSYKTFASNITGQSYTGLETDVTAAGQLTKVVYTGLKTTPYTTLEQDFANGALATSTFTFNASAGQSYSSYSVTQNAAGAQLSETINNTDGSHTILGSAPNLIFEAIGNDRITGGGSGETFDFSTVFGHDTITDFSGHIAGAGHDTISLSTADFTDFASVVASAQNVAGGVAFTGHSGSQLTLLGINKSTLAGLGADFTFHA